MGVNMVGNCIFDDEACCEASKQEILRRYYDSLLRKADLEAKEDELFKIEFLMQQLGITREHRLCAKAANDRASEINVNCAAIELHDGRIVTGKTSALLGPCSAVILNSLKELAGIDTDLLLISRKALEPIQKLKTEYFGSRNPRLHTDEVLVALSICAITDENAQKALDKLPELKNCEVHTSVILSQTDERVFRRLGVNLTQEAKYQTSKLYHQ
jgi:uncharacterized protein (UPF0371 family)